VVGKGLETPYHKREQLVTKCYTGPRIWTDSLERPRQGKTSGSEKGPVADP